MCLDTVKKVMRDEPDNKTITAYKVVRKVGLGEYIPSCMQSPSLVGSLEQKKWHDARPVRIRTVSGDYYLAGFHAFRALSAARNWLDENRGEVVVEVKIRKTVAVGKQFGRITYVALQQKIVREIK